MRSENIELGCAHQRPRASGLVLNAWAGVPELRRGYTCLIGQVRSYCGTPQAQSPDSVQYMDPRYKVCGLDTTFTSYILSRY
jgi:hypothetical protein